MFAMDRNIAKVACVFAYFSLWASRQLLLLFILDWAIGSLTTLVQDVGVRLWRAPINEKEHAGAITIRGTTSACVNNMEGNTVLYSVYLRTSIDFIP